MKAKDIRPGDYFVTANGEKYEAITVFQGKEKVLIEAGEKSYFVRDLDEEDAGFYKGENRLPIRGDKILVSNDFEKWEERIFLEFRGNIVSCVFHDYEQEYTNGYKHYNTYCWFHWKWPEEKETTEIKEAVEEAKKLVKKLEKLIGDK